MIKYLDELNSVFEKMEISADEAIIVGSGAITAFGGRYNNDLEFCLSDYASRKLPLSIRLRLMFVDHVDLSDNIDLFRNRYICYGVRDKDLFTNRLYWPYEGYYIVKPEYELAYKKVKKREKDNLDIRQIRARTDLYSKFNWEYVSELVKGASMYYCALEKFRGINWRIMQYFKFGGGKLH